MSAKYDILVNRIWLLEKAVSDLLQHVGESDSLVKAQALDIARLEAQLAVPAPSAPAAPVEPEPDYDGLTARVESLTSLVQAVMPSPAPAPQPAPQPAAEAAASAPAPVDYPGTTPDHPALGA